MTIDVGLSAGGPVGTGKMRSARRVSNEPERHVIFVVINCVEYDGYFLKSFDYVMFEFRNHTNRVFFSLHFLIKRILSNNFITQKIK